MIGANYSEMLNDASQISKSADEYMKSVNELYAVVDNLGSVWKGTDNVDYINTVNSYKEDIMALGKVVDNYAIFINKAAEILNETQSGIADSAKRL